MASPALWHSEARPRWDIVGTNILELKGGESRKLWGLFPRFLRNNVSRPIHTSSPHKGKHPNSEDHPSMNSRAPQFAFSISNDVLRKHLSLTFQGNGYKRLKYKHSLYFTLSQDKKVGDKNFPLQAVDSQPWVFPPQAERCPGGEAWPPSLLPNGSPCGSHSCYLAGCARGSLPLAQNVDSIAFYSGNKYYCKVAWSPPPPPWNYLKIILFWKSKSKYLNFPFPLHWQ